MEAIINCDSFVVATPTMWGYPHSSLVRLLQKMTTLEHNRYEITRMFGRAPIEDKHFVALISQDVEGASMVFSGLAYAFNSQGFAIPSFGLTFKPNYANGYLAKFGLWATGHNNKLAWIGNNLRLSARTLSEIPNVLRDWRRDDGLVEEPIC